MIFNYFKEEFSVRLKKGIFPIYDEILKKSLFEYNLQKEDIDENLFYDWFFNICQLNFLSNYINDDAITEIIIHSYKIIQIEKNSKLIEYSLDLEAEIFELSLDYLALIHNQSWNYSTPFSSFKVLLQNHHFRVSMQHRSLSPIDHSKIFIRRINNNVFTLQQFAVEKALESFLIDSIQGKKNIMIAGATGSGKTGLLKSLLHYIPTSEHVITLEDTYELTNLPATWSSLLANEKRPFFSLHDLCAYSLRMRPDRMIMGEIRSKEAVPFLLSMNNGHTGLMATIHANSAADCLKRLALLFILYSENSQIPYFSVMKLVCSNLDYVIYLKNKKVTEIIKVLGSQESGMPLFNEIYPAL